MFADIRPTHHHVESCQQTVPEDNQSFSFFMKLTVFMMLFAMQFLLDFTEFGKHFKFEMNMIDTMLKAYKD